MARFANDRISRTPFCWLAKTDQRHVRATSLGGGHQGVFGRKVILHAAGRTDTGVHATGQVCHVDLEKETDASTVRDAINFHVRPYTVSVLHAEEVAQDFHARFSATQRVYLYRVTNRRGPLAIGRGLSWHIVPELDTDAMHAAAQLLLGKHDFTTFRAARCQADSPTKTLDLLDVVRDGRKYTHKCKSPVVSFITRCATWWELSSWSGRGSGLLRM